MDNIKNPNSTFPSYNLITSTKEHPFGLPWLDSSYLETLLPGTPWQNVSDILSQPLVEVTREQFSNDHRKQMIIELVGNQFRRSYLTDENDNPWLLFPPNMTEEQRRKLENEAKSWLQIKINETALDKNCAVRPNQSEDLLSNEMKDFLEHTYHVITTSMDRYFYIKQNKLGQGLKKKPNDTNKNDDKELDVKSVRSLNMLQKYASKNTLRELLKNKKNMSAIQEQNKKYTGELTSEYSEMIGDSLLYILRKDPRRIGFVIRKLIGQQLPNNVRQFIWSDILMRNERKRNDSPADIELIVRKNFATGVTRGKNELKLKDPSLTPVSSLIENAVIETYSRVAPMQLWLEEHHLREAMKVLNVLYTYSRDYEPYLIYWLLPFQLAYSKGKNKSELIYDLAMYLDLYTKNCFPQWNEVFTISGKVMTDLSVADPEFYDHLKFITKKNTKINPKDFVNEIIYNEGKQAGNYLIDSNDTSPAKTNKDLLGDPVIFLRKWIGEAFGGILNPNALLYVWDQLFMSLWASIDIEIITKAILYLLRAELMKANDYDEMRKVFLDEPCKLFTSDIQSAFMHITSGGREIDVAGLNRRNTNEHNFGNQVQDLDNDNYNKYLNTNGPRKKPTLEPFALKNFRLLLVVPKQGITSDFDPSHVSVEASLYYGETKLANKITDGISLVKDIKPSLQETKTYEVEIPDMIIFDLSQYEKDIVPTSSREIFVILSTRYKTTTYNDLYLGYCKVIIYKPQKIGSINTWDITLGDIQRLLHPGAQPFDPINVSDIPKTSFKERLGPNSTIIFNVLNPRTDTFLNKFSKIT